jgi:hypothetical protein
MVNPTPIAIVNRSTVLTDAAITAVIPAIQKQISSQLASAWNVDAVLSFVGLGGPTPAAGNWALTITDNTDDPAGDLGYHSSDANGPYAKVFAKTSLDAQQEWSSVLSHELLEMLVNPLGCLAAFIPWDDSGVRGTYYDLEVCDPVYPKDQCYSIDNVLVSDFVFPAWFAPWITKAEAGRTTPKVDQADRVQAALQLAPGAVVSISGKASLNGPAPSASTAAFARTPSTLMARHRAGSKA